MDYNKNTMRESDKEIGRNNSRKKFSNNKSGDDRESFRCVFCDERHLSSRCKNVTNREFTPRQEYDYDYVNGRKKGLGLIVIVIVIVSLNLCLR